MHRIKNDHQMKLKIAIAGFIFMFSMNWVIAQQEGYLLRNAKEINTPQLDFSPVPFRNGILFTSSKSDRFLQCPPENAGDFTDIFFSPLLPDGSFGPKELLQGELNGKYNDGVAAVLPGTEKLIITRNNTLGKNAADVIDLKLYSLDWVDGAWFNSVAVPFNSEDWSTAHPAISWDGKLLVFSSNRPGSINGSMDLWFSRNENGQWAEPVNAGPNINTAGNELFPSLDEYHNLYFSSNGHGGAGGLDLFGARPDSAGGWQLVGNLGMPFSQAGDDVSFFPMENRSRGYYSGVRGDGAGLDDVYSWLFNPQAIDLPIEFIVKDSNTYETIPFAEMVFDISTHGSVLDALYEPHTHVHPDTLTTDANGHAIYKVRKGNIYEIITSKPGYKTDFRDASCEQIEEVQPYVILLAKEKKSMSELTVFVGDSVNKLPIPFANVIFRDKVSGTATTLTADSLGKVTIQVDCNSSFVIEASKTPWRDGAKEWIASLRADCDNGKFQDSVLLAPSGLTLEPIFFSFDKSDIRSPDAEATLDALETILRRHPSLRVRLEAHCDARGTNEYNNSLAMKRSNAAKKYLVSKGIEASRFELQWYGEQKPINDCKDKVRCSEMSHQLNRRVDVIPLDYNEAGLEFRARLATEMKVRSDRQ